MTEVLCGVCEIEPKKYKCPTCAIPYCSLECFKLHKPTHATSDDPPSIDKPSQPQIELPQPPPPAPIPRYLKKQTDFSILSSNPDFHELLKTQPTLLSSLQRVYAATIEPDPEDAPGFFRGNRGRGFHGRGRGRGDRGRGRGHYSFGGDDRGPPKWTQKKGDADAMRMLKGLREGKRGNEEKEAMAAFVGLVEGTFSHGEEGHAREEAQNNMIL